MAITDNTAIWKVKKISNIFNVGADVGSFEALRLAYEERFNNLSEALRADYEARFNTLIEQTNNLVTTKLAELPPAVYMATCATALATTAKVATVTNADNFVLREGVMVLVTFTDSPSKVTLEYYLKTLNVNNTGAITVHKYTAEANGSNISVHNNKVLFMYDGAKWIIISTLFRVTEIS